MSGPFSLRYLHLFVSHRSAGAFILSRNGKSADLVGASPDDVASTIGRLARPSAYRFFWFAYAASPEEAFHIEHTWYHRYHPNDNLSPPSRQHGLDWRCTEEGCAACALAHSRS